jgi:Flp pilus assembly protein TadD
MRQMTTPPPQLSSRRLFIFGGAVAVLGLALLLYTFKFSKILSGDDFARLTNVGKNYFDKGEAEKAVASFQQALQLNTAHPDAHLNLANAYFLAGQNENVIKEAQEVLSLDRNSAAAHYLIGCVNLRLGKNEDALKELQESQNIDPAVTALNFQLSLAHEKLGHLEDAARELEAVIKFEPDHPAAHYRLSQLLLRLGNKEEANQHLEQHRQIIAKKPGVPTDPSAYERCKHTQARLPFQMEQPDPRGVKVVFADATQAAFGNATSFRGPIGVIDLNHDGQNSLFVLEGENGFRLLQNSNGVFSPQGDLLPTVAGAKYRHCLVGDLQNDRVDDIIVLGENASHVFKGATNGVLRDITTFSGMKDLKGSDGALVDLDFTGKLDLVTVAPEGNGVRVYRNLGNLYFKDNTAASGAPAAFAGVRQIALEDWNMDEVNDLFVVRAGQPPQYFPKARGGALITTNSPPDWPSAIALALGDLNNDLRPDMVVATDGKLEIIFSGLKDHLSFPLANRQLTSLNLLDYDNDGWLDIVVAGDGLRVWRNLGTAGFREVTQDLGLDKLATRRIGWIAFADFDRDGDSDILLGLETGGLQLLRNDGGNANQQLKLRLLGTRSNASGIGIRIDVASGGLRLMRRVWTLPVEIGVGKYQQLDSLTAQWANINLNNADVKVEPRAQFTLMELQIQDGSCPYLYAWDGKSFRFVTDLLGASPLGLPVAENRYIDADTEEFVRIGDEKMFAPRDGNYLLQITEELREMLYLDEAKLVVVDHPPETEVHSTSKLRPGKPYPPGELITLHQRRPLLKAAREDGADVTTLLAEADNQLVSPKLREPQLRGLAEPHSITLDFGPLPVERPLVLALTGWLRFGGGMANIAASHNPDLPFPFPTLEVETSDGKWKPVDVVVGAPAGKTKTIVVDLTGKLPTGSRRLRLSEAFEIHWDRIALFEKRDPSDTMIYRLAPTKTDLHWRGFGELANLPWYMPLTPVYEKVKQTPPWRITPMGWCTRYGEVDELISGRDNALALLNGGDELTLSFAADKLPKKSAGTARDFLLYTVGWDKDSDFHVARGLTVGPLPFHGMDDQLYGRQPRADFSDDDWIKNYNTRWVGPYTLRREK